MEQALNLARKENAQLRQDFEKMSEVISQKIQESLDQAFLAAPSSNQGAKGSAVGV